MSGEDTKRARKFEVSFSKVYKQVIDLPPCMFYKKRNPPKTNTFSIIKHSYLLFAKA